MRVMHVIEAMHQGGAESLVVEHVRRAAPDVQSTVVALNRGGPTLALAEAAGAHAVVLGKGSARAGGLARLAALMRERRVDVVNGHNPSGALYATLAARWAGVPAVVRTEHSIHYRGRGSRGYAPVEALLTVLTDRVISVCEAAHDSHSRRFPWARKRFVSIANGIDEAIVVPDHAGARSSLGVADDTVLVLSVGSLTPQKSQDVLLEGFARAAERVPTAALWIAGEGRLEAALREQHARTGLGDRVRLLGARQDVDVLMAACDLFVLSSSREGLSVTLLEAMRAARTCVATAVGGNAEAVADGETGRIVASGDAGALAAAIAELASDRPRLEQWGQAGRRRFEERFTAERMVRETEALYRMVLASKGRGGRRAADRS